MVPELIKSEADPGAANPPEVKIKEVNTMTINTELSLNGCWRMVNAIQNGRTDEEIRERCGIAEKWLIANKVINYDEFNELMKTVAFLYRESYH